MSDKVRARLNKLEAEFIGLKVKESENGRNTARYRITQEQHQEVILLRTTPNKRRFLKIKPDFTGSYSGHLTTFDGLTSCFRINS